MFSQSACVGTLDEPNRVQINDHVWVRQRIPWFDVKDDLPRFEESSNAVASKARDDSLNRRGHSSSFEECPLPLIKG